MCQKLKETMAIGYFFFLKKKKEKMVDKAEYFR
jgi:hypothetical protein